MNAGPTMFIKISHCNKTSCLPLHKINSPESKQSYSMQIIKRYKESPDVLQYQKKC